MNIIKTLIRILVLIADPAGYAEQYMTSENREKAGIKID
jgi:hypothetical protein